jgi:hypothetical protein
MMREERASYREIEMQKWRRIREEYEAKIHEKRLQLLDTKLERKKKRLEDAERRIQELKDYYEKLALKEDIRVIAREQYENDIEEARVKRYETLAMTISR